MKPFGFMPAGLILKSEVTDVAFVIPFSAGPTVEVIADILLALISSPSGVMDGDGAAYHV